MRSASARLDAAALHVEDLFGVDRTDRRTVIGFDVVRGDLERRHRIDVCLRREQERVVAQRASLPCACGAIRMLPRKRACPRSRRRRLDERFGGRVAGAMVDGANEVDVLRVRVERRAPSTARRRPALRSKREDRRRRARRRAPPSSSNVRVAARARRARYRSRGRHRAPSAATA